MKKLHFSVLIIVSIVLAFFILSCNQQKQTVDVEADIAAIKEVLKKYEETVNAGDFDSWISLWVDDGVRMPPGATSKIGITQITDEMKPVFEQFKMTASIEIEDAKVFGDIGLTTCSGKISMTPKTGGDTIAVLPDAKALTIYKKQDDGNWKIIYDCFNSNLPPAQ